jgi:hypothetical protein
MSYLVAVPEMLAASLRRHRGLPTVGQVPGYWRGLVVTAEVQCCLSIENRYGDGYFASHNCPGTKVRRNTLGGIAVRIIQYTTRTRQHETPSWGVVRIGRRALSPIPTPRPHPIWRRRPPNARGSKPPFADLKTLQRGPRISAVGSIIALAPEIVVGALALAVFGRSVGGVIRGVTNW